MWLNLFNKVPSLRLIIPYIFGIFLIGEEKKLILFAALFSLWCYCSNKFLQSRLSETWNIRWLYGMSYVGLWFSIGCVSGLHAMSKSAFPEGLTGKIVAEVCLKKEPVKKKKSYQIYAETIRVTPEKLKGKMFIFYLQQSEKIKSLRTGDRIIVRFNPVKPNNNFTGLSFDYNKWLRQKGICATAYIRTKEWFYLKGPEKTDLIARADRLSGKIVSIFKESGLEGNSLGLASAMSIGYRSDIDKKVESYFRAAGITHVLSVSGLHVGVIYSLICFCLFFLKYGKTQKVLRNIIIVIFLWLYAFIAGLCPSVCRSALMLSMVSTGDFLGRKSQTLNTVIFSAFILLLVNPLNIYDIGFQLSYVAVIGIVVLYPELRLHFEPKSVILKYIRDLVLISLVAQIATFPLTIHYFGQFPNYFLLANLFAVPLSGLLIFVSAGCIVSHDIPFLGIFFSGLLEISTTFFLKVSAFIGNLPLAVTDNISISFFQVVLIYMLIYFSYGFFFLRKRVYSWSLLTTIIILQISVLFNQLTNAS